METETPGDCVRFESASWLLISGEAEGASLAFTERHAATCPDCARLLSRRRHFLDVYDGLVPEVKGTLDTPRPVVPKRRPTALQRPAPAIAAAMILLLVGGLVGFLQGRHGLALGTLQGVERRLDELEVRLAVAQIDRPTAAERLKATTASVAIIDRDPRVVDSLVEALVSDPSPNVRMAAIDALYRAARVAPLQTRLGELLAAQDSSILRIALIELAADRKLKGALDDLRREAAESHDPAVRDRAQWAITELTRGT